jgi:site-specific DNA-methyltransferase (cytosine-N4-specific)
MKMPKIPDASALPLNDSIIIEGDALTVLRRLPGETAQCIVTSPPYWGLRDYNIPQQIGLEPTLSQYINKLVCIFSEAKRVLADDGILWLNIGRRLHERQSRLASARQEEPSARDEHSA